MILLILWCPKISLFLRSVILCLELLMEFQIVQIVFDATRDKFIMDGSLLYKCFLFVCFVLVLVVFVFELLSSDLFVTVGSFLGFSFASCCFSNASCFLALPVLD